MLRLLVVVISFAYASCDNWGLIHLTTYTDEMQRCIENHDSIKALRSDEKSKNLEIDAFIGLPVRDITGVTITRESILSAVRSTIIDNIGYINSQHIISDLKFAEDLEAAIAKALEDCYDDDDGNGNSVESLSFVRLPQFLQESNGIGTLLDHILVNWNASLRDMITDRNSRTLLSRYAGSGVESLFYAYTGDSHAFFHSSLRGRWIDRATIFFDGRNSELPYIDHTFSAEYPTPHTHGDTQRFISRRSVDYDIRNPRAAPSDQSRILNMYPAVNSRSDIYGRYRRNGMNSDDYYFEHHLNQFYRIIFFFLEMQLHGIPQNTDDIPEHIGRILYDDNAYREYLIRRRGELIHGENNQFRDRLRRSDRVREVDLIVLLGMRLSSGVIETTTTTTTEYSASTTPKFEEEEKRNGGFGRIVSKWMKKFSKKFKGTFNDEYFGLINGPISERGETKFLMDIMNIFYQELCLHKYI